MANGLQLSGSEEEKKSGEEAKVGWRVRRTRSCEQIGSCWWYLIGVWYFLLIACCCSCLHGMLQLLGQLLMLSFVAVFRMFFFFAKLLLIVQSLVRWNCYRKFLEWIICRLPTTTTAGFEIAKAWHWTTRLADDMAWMYSMTGKRACWNRISFREFWLSTKLNYARQIQCVRKCVYVWIEIWKLESEVRYRVLSEKYGALKKCQHNLFLQHEALFSSHHILDFLHFAFFQRHEINIPSRLWRPLCCASTLATAFVAATNPNEAHN